MILGAVLVASAQIADLVSFASVLAIGPIEGELNPLIRALGTAGGLPAVIALKIFGLVVMLVVIDLLRDQRFWMRATAVAVPVGVGLAGAAANLTSLALALR